MTHSKTYRIGIEVFKWIVAIAGFFFIYRQVFLKSEYTLFKENILNYYTINNIILYLIPVMILMIVNWGIESYKWMYVIKPIEKIKILRAVKGTLAGVATGFFTPNRVGEFGGRILFLETKDKITASLFTIAGSFSQLISTLIFGSIGLFLYSLFVHEYNVYINIALFFVIFLCLGATIILYYNFSQLSNFINLSKIWPSFHVKLQNLKLIPKEKLNHILWVSIFRYITFTIQYVLLLYFFKINISFYNAMVCVSVIYLLHTAIPTIAILEAGVRGAGAIAVLAPFSTDYTSILLAAYTLWLINIILPSLLGLIILGRYKINSL